MAPRLPAEKPNTDALAREVLAFLTRHVAWLERNARELAEAASGPGADPESLLLRSEQRALELEESIAEMNALSERWHDAQGVSEAKRAEVREMAAKAQQMADRLVEEFAKADKGAQVRAQGVEAQIQGLRRSVRIAGRLRPVELFMDTLYLDKRI